MNYPLTSWPRGPATLLMFGVSSLAFGQLDYAETPSNLREEMRASAEQHLSGTVLLSLVSAKPAKIEAATGTDERLVAPLGSKQLSLLAVDSEDPVPLSNGSEPKPSVARGATSVRSLWPAALTAMLPWFLESSPAALTLSSNVVPRAAVRLTALRRNRGNAPVDLESLTSIFPAAPKALFQDNTDDLETLTALTQRRAK